MLEFHEKATGNGQFTATLVSDKLKATGSTCKVFAGEKAWDGSVRFIRKTCNGQPGSTRYASFKTLDEAYATSRAWAKRKIAAHKRDQSLSAAAIFIRFARVLGNPQADSRGYVR
jgi:hypothetical protein